jgi:tetratricopeptide (TPR) repeat protein
VLCAASALAPHALAQPLDPAARHDRAERLRILGEAYVQSGDSGSAVGYFREALSIDATDARSYEGLARIYLSRGNLRDALEALAVGLRRQPEDGGLWGAYADVLLAQGDLTGAAEALRERLTRAPDDVGALITRADVARRRGAWAEALACSRRVVDLAARGVAVAPERLSEARAFIAALSVLAGSTDPVRGAVERCDHASFVRNALGGCARPAPPAPTPPTPPARGASGRGPNRSR